MRGIADTAAATTRKARRDAERRSRIGGVRAARRAAALPALDDIPADDVGDGRAADGGAAVPFEVIEQW